MSKKVLILAPYFDPHTAYIETLIARAGSEEGDEVSVVCSDFPVFEGEATCSDAEGYRIHRIRGVLRVRKSLYLYSREAYKVIEDLKPEVVFCMVPDRGFSGQILKAVSEEARVVSVFGDLRLSGNTPNLVLRKLLKGKWYRQAFDRSDVIVGITNETRSVLIDDFGAPEEKTRVLGLPFDGDEFYPSENVHESIRDLRERCDAVFGVITRIDSSKPLLKWMEIAHPVLKSDARVGMAVVGLGEDPASEQLRDLVARWDERERVVLLPKLSQADLVKVYAGLDLSLWFQASIGVQQSMACGVPVVAPKSNYLDHFAKQDMNGRFYREGGQAEALKQALMSEWNVQMVADSVDGFEKTQHYKLILA